MSNDNIAFIGGGNMTRAIAAGLIEGKYPPMDLLISEPAIEQRAVLARDLPGVIIEESNDGVASRADTVVLAVKPQVMREVCHGLANTVQKTRPLIVSVAAGIRSGDIDTWLGGGLPVVRIMPNQPALLRLGASGLFANQRTSDEQKERATRILAAVGHVVPVASDADIDAVTAISGTGPAYFYLLIDMMIKSAQEFGLDAQAARILTIETAKGAAAIADAEDETMESLIERVRSPGGTTTAAFDSLDADHVRDIFARAFEAARDRAVVLADDANKNQG
ncbi:MAG: pyrroline-5-carboxylate reductase [Woeseiaceae bacterium]|nr:pyrroline-5-carboxylate reductase [Woeseiaceae bacterium]